MIEEMIAQGRYQEALDSLDDLDDEQVRYYRLMCLYGLGQYENGLREATSAKIQAKDTYYDVLCYYLYFLKECEQYETAIQTLVEELSMPYIPYEYESKLNEVYDEILLEKREAMAVYEGQKVIMNDEELEMFLLKGGSVETAPFALEQLASRNIRQFLYPIEQFLKNPERSSLDKSMLLEILRDQEVDYTFEVCKHDYNVEVNPLYLQSVLESDIYMSCGVQLEQVIEDENPALFEMCIQFLEYYLYDWYPMFELYESYEALSCAIHGYVAALANIDADLEDLSYTYGASYETVLELYKQISDVKMSGE